MKRLTSLFFLGLTVLALSCKKSNSSGGDSTYYVKATIDGATTNFNTGTMAVKTTLAGVTSLAIIGATGTASNGYSMTISMNNGTSNKPFIAGTYSEVGISDFVVGAGYAATPSGALYVAGAYPNPPNPLKVIITSIDNATVKGTFTGDFYLQNATTGTLGPAKKTITGGEFYVKIQTQ